MNCAEANQSGLVEYLYLLGHQPQKIRGENYWYLSPLREENTASFKVNKPRNIWYDHGLGCGGKTVDFAMQYFSCSLSEALQKISLFYHQYFTKKKALKEPVHRHQNARVNEGDATEPAIQITAAKQPITDPSLCHFIQSRKISEDIANKFCSEVYYSLTDKIHSPIGFKNSAGGYELRNECFKGSSSPKYVTYVHNNAPNIKVSEGFFDYLSYCSMHQNSDHAMTNFLVLNSLSFFERTLLLMEKHARVYLYLDHDKAGRRCTEIALKRSMKFKDESKLYKGFKDFNEWMMNSKNIIRKQPSIGRYL